MSHRLAETIYLTGAGRGIGRATALALAARGYRLGLIDRDAEGLREVAERLDSSGCHHAVRCADVTDLASVRAATAELDSKVGPPDVLVACAGVGGLTLLPDLQPEALRTMLDVNVVGVAHAIDAVLPGMIARKRGHLVGISSVAGYRGMPWMAAYSASKAALTTYLEGLRPALKRRGVTITTVYPGFVRTAMTEGTPFRRPIRMMEPEQAAAYLVRAIERRPRDAVFPFGTALGMGFLRRMPGRVYDWMMDRAGPEALTVEF
ncbi:SDR family NAD(P)-dependent oxidoreductase [Tautonia marina]|uniref:SDR family NAD(P)-dependent oxidoreductase n=1 Tax=Tautonia marina TaxID=2653855 RepID=UPI00126127B1|nr:SDR family NAD(P)-dependent oxidoreductase [Tautonia marina]